MSTTAQCAEACELTARPQLLCGKVI